MREINNKIDNKICLQFKLSMILTCFLISKMGVIIVLISCSYCEY